jgi:hypothetical protein
MPKFESIGDVFLEFCFVKTTPPSGFPSNEGMDAGLL